MAKYGKFVGKESIPVSEWMDVVNGFVGMIKSYAEACGIPFKECVVSKQICGVSEYLQISFCIDGEVSGRNYFGDRVRGFSCASFLVRNNKLNDGYRSEGLPESQYSMFGVIPSCKVARYRCRNFNPFELRNHYFYGTEVSDFASEIHVYLDELETELGGLLPNVKCGEVCVKYEF